MAVIFALQAVVSEIQAHLQNCHVWALNLATGQSSTSCAYTPFLPHGSKLSLFSLYGPWLRRYRLICKIAIFGHKTWPLAKVPEVAHARCFYPRELNWAYFHSMGSGFWDTGRFSKLPYLGMKPGHWEKSARSCTYALFLPQGVEIEPIFVLRAVVFKMRTIFKVAIFGHETWQVAKLPELAHILSFYPGLKLNFFRSKGKRFPRYEPIFKIDIFGHETWSLVKVPEIAHILSFYLMGSKLNLFSLYGQGFQRYWMIFKIAMYIYT